MIFRVSSEALRKRSEYDTESSKSKSPTFLQRFLSLLIPLLFIVSILPVYIVVAGNRVLTVIYYVGVGVTLLVNVVIASEIVGSICWHRRCAKRREFTSCMLGTRHTATIVSAYLPNEPLDSLRATLKAMTLLKRQEMSRLTVIMGHNGGSQDKVRELERVIREIQAEIDPRDAEFVEVIGLHHKFSKSKAENVNGSINFLQAMGPDKPEVVALYDADHQPHASSMLIACAELEASESDVVQGRCIIRSGSWIIGLEFDVMYAVFHSGGRLLRGFGLFGGTNGFWRTEVLHKIKMNPARLTEDIDSGIRALRGGYNVTYNPTILSYEEAPPSFGALAKQRMRWSQGWAEVSAMHISAAFERNPSLSIRRRVHLFLVLQFREIFPYIVIHAAMACVGKSDMS
jgi:cellulose synthase/poly-beta-1,6-N-acetylglucosamine synthase-like glycosyltransferase